MNFVKALTLSLILGLIYLNLPESGRSDMASRVPSSVTREGQYHLVSGTKGCADSIIWIDQCAGFVLNPRKGETELDTEKFCHMNRGMKVTTEDGQKLMTQVEQKDRYVRKAQNIVDRNGLTTTVEDTIIFDSEKEQFLWEHSRNQKGASCLYSK